MNKIPNPEERSLVGNLDTSKLFDSDLSLPNPTTSLKLQPSSSIPQISETSSEASTSVASNPSTSSFLKSNSATASLLHTADQPSSACSFFIEAELLEFSKIIKESKKTVDKMCGNYEAKQDPFK